MYGLSVTFPPCVAVWDWVEEYTPCSIHLLFRSFLSPLGLKSLPPLFQSCPHVRASQLHLAAVWDCVEEYTPCSRHLLFRSFLSPLGPKSLLPLFSLVLMYVLHDCTLSDLTYETVQWETPSLHFCFPALFYYVLSDKKSLLPFPVLASCT